MGIFNKKTSDKLVVAAINGQHCRVHLFDLCSGKPKQLACTEFDYINFDELEDILIKSSIGRATIHQSDPIVTSARHKGSLDSAHQSIELARRSLKAGLSSELVALDMRAALDALGEIIGEVTNEDILGNIFSKFCIGK